MIAGPRPRGMFFFVGARYIVPALRIPSARLHPPLEHPASDRASHLKRAPKVHLTPLSATLTKNEGVLPNARRSSTSFVGAQFIAPTSPRLPKLSCPTNASLPRSEATPTMRLNPLNATFTKTRGLLVEP